MKATNKAAKSNELILAAALFDVAVKLEQVQGIIGSIVTNEGRDIDQYFRSALWGALAILNDAEDVIEVTSDDDYKTVK